MRKGYPLAIIILVAAVAVSTVLTYTPSSKPTLRVFLGAAAQKPWCEIIAKFEEETGIKVEATYGGSGTLLSQLEVAKIGDIYGTGSHDYMEKAIAKGIVNPASVVRVAYLIPAIIVPKGNPKNITSLEDLAKPGIRVGIGDPQTVCVGLYAVEVLKHNGLYDDVAKNIVVHAESCSKVAMLVPSGAVDAVIGWHVFHYWYPNETDVVWLKPEQIPKIACIPIGITTFAENVDAAKKFINFVKTSEFVKETFRKYHYFATLEEAKKYAPFAQVPEI